MNDANAPLDWRTAPLTGRVLIEASAGTGKTWNIGLIFLRLILEENFPVEKILVVTFTNAATEPNVVATSTVLTNRNRIRGLSSRSLTQGQPVLQGTTEAPRVIAFTPAPGNVLVVQGSGISNNGLNIGTGQVRAQIVEVPAP